MKKKDISLVSKKGGSRLPGTGPVSIAPSCKTQSACHEETFIDNVKQELKPSAGHSA